MGKKKKKRNSFSSRSKQYISEGNNTKSGVIEPNSLSVDDVSVDNSSRVDRDVEADNQTEDGFVNFDYHPEADASTWCTLSTELVQLLEAFQSMIHGFSGDGVSEVAEPGFYEVQNTLTWHSDFSKLYDVNSEAEDTIKKLSAIRQVSSSTRATTIGSVGEDSFRIRRISESSEQRSQERPSFLSSTILDQDSSEDLSPHIVLPGPPPKASHTIVPAPMKVNLSSNLGAPEFDPKPMCVQNRGKPCQKITTACCSRLFWWIAVLMVSRNEYQIRQQNWISVLCFLLAT